MKKLASIYFNRLNEMRSGVSNLLKIFKFKNIMNPTFHKSISCPGFRIRRWFEENIGCENACPVNTRAPQYISAIREENYDLSL